MIAKNHTGKVKKKQFTALFFANGCNKTPSKTLVFKRMSTGHPWTKTKEQPLNCEQGFSEVFRNAFSVSSAEGIECLVIVRDEHIVLLDDELN